MPPPSFIENYIFNSFDVKKKKKGQFLLGMI